MTHGRFIDRLASGPHFPRQQGGRFAALGVLAAAALVASCGVTETGSGASALVLEPQPDMGQGVRRPDGRAAISRGTSRSAGFGIPWHVHHTEDESFYVVAGRIAVVWKAINGCRSMTAALRLGRRVFPTRFASRVIGRPGSSC